MSYRQAIGADIAAAVDTAVPTTKCRRVMRERRMSFPPEYVGTPALRCRAVSYLARRALYQFGEYSPKQHSRVFEQDD